MNDQIKMYIIKGKLNFAMSWQNRLVNYLQYFKLLNQPKELIYCGHTQFLERVYT